MKSTFASLAFCGVVLSACNVPILEIVYCEDMDYQSALGDGADRIEVWPGTPKGYGAGPLLKMESSQRVTRIVRFFMERAEQWYVPASYQSDSDMIDHWGHYTVRFFRGDTEVSTIRMTGVQLITGGCNAQTIKVLSPKEAAVLHNLLYETPIHAHVE